MTLDYAYVTLAWELDIADLKKLSLNGIKYSSVGEDVKKHLLENVFAEKWHKWIDWLNALEIKEELPERPKE